MFLNFKVYYEEFYEYCEFERNNSGASDNTLRACELFANTFPLIVFNAHKLVLAIIQLL